MCLRVTEEAQACLVIYMKQKFKKLFELSVAQTVFV